MSIRIPTGPVSKNTARNVSFTLGLVALAVSFYAPQYSDAVQKLAAALAGLGLTLGKAEQ